MAQSLGGLVFGVGHYFATNSLRRQVKRYLDEATCDSVCNDLGKVLLLEMQRAFGGKMEREFMQTTFDKYCVQEALGQKYWNEVSFRKQVRSNHTETAVSEAAVLLLWRSFHFYAHHPFPRDTENGKVDFDAFQRAVLLLVFQCEDILGTQDDEYYLWRNRAASLYKATFQRVFRSIAGPESILPVQKGTKTYPQHHYRTYSIVSDVMDVLLMVVPQFIHALPSPEQLEPVAVRLLTGIPGIAPRVVRRQEIPTLMSLLLRMELRKEKWCWLLNLGGFAEDSLAGQELTEALVDYIMGAEGDQTITSEEILEAMNIIPNLQGRFHQLWAVLFQPAESSIQETEPSRASDVAPTYIGGAISLFAPQIKSESPLYHYRGRTRKEDSRIVLQGQVTSDPQNITLARLFDVLSQNASACVVLFTGDDCTEETRRVVVGAYFPGHIDVTSSTEAEKEEEEEEEEGASRGDDSTHLLFQLLPIFRFLRWEKPEVPLVNLINVERAQVSSGKMLQSKFNMPYRIGMLLEKLPIFKLILKTKQ